MVVGTHCEQTKEPLSRVVIQRMGVMEGRGPRRVMIKKKNKQKRGWRRKRKEGYAVRLIGSAEL
jgi:hypothetical protein